MTRKLETQKIARLAEKKGGKPLLAKFRVRSTDTKVKALTQSTDGSQTLKSAQLLYRK